MAITIADFRKDNKAALIGIFKEFSLFCDEMKLIGKEIVAIDGSKFRACNSRRKNFTKRKIEKMLEHYEQSAKKYLELLEKIDEIIYVQKLVPFNHILAIFLIKRTAQPFPLSEPLTVPSHILI